MPAHGQIASLREVLVETGEQFFNRTGLGQVLAKQPDRLGIGHPILQPEAKKAHEAQPVADLKLRLVVGEIVKRLQHQNFEHQHRVIGRSAALGPIGPLQRFGERLAKELEIDHRTEPLQRVTTRAQLRQTLVQIEKPRLSRHLCTLLCLGASESDHRRFGEGF